MNMFRDGYKCETPNTFGDLLVFILKTNLPILMLFTHTNDVPTY